MKKLFPFLFIFVYINSQGQSLPCSVLPPDFWCNSFTFLDTLDLTQDSALIDIDTLGGCNTWVLGHSYKTVFDSSASPLGLVTDTISPYGINVNCGFILKVPSDFFWGTTIVLFEHKYDTDSLLDGGYLEFSCDYGQNWRKINSTEWQQDQPPLMIKYFNYAGLPNSFYDNTMPALHDTIPAFTGTNGEWQWSGIQLLWYLPVMKPDENRWQDCFNIMGGGNDTLYVRFNFESDGINTGKAGWMIRNIVYGTSDLGGSIAEFSSQSLKIFPNPASQNISIELPPNSGKLIQIRIMDIAGRETSTLTPQIQERGTIDVSYLVPGIYFVLAETDKFVFRQKLVKQ